MSSSPAGTDDPAPAPAAAPISPLLDFFAGTVAGIASLLTGHPFDTIKVRLQTQRQVTDGREKYYRNAWHAFARVVREEKVGGLYKGVTSPMLGVALINASVFSSYKFAMNLQLSSPSEEPTLGQITVAGAASGVFTSFITTPIERLKILQQASTPSASSQPSLLTLLRSNSLRSLYRGFLPTLLRDVAYGPYFLVYEYIVRGGNFGRVGGKGGGEEGRRHVKPDLAEEVENELFGPDKASPGRVLLAGGAAGIVGWGCTFPLDVVKTKMQATSLPSSFSFVPLPSSPSSTSSPNPPTPPHPYATLRSTIIASYREAGLKGFVAGLGPTLVRSVPVNMVTFAVFELVVATFG
ncbi:hypothetical protein JCM21900_003680 [Sporobolomyces salmonicolor]